MPFTTMEAAEDAILGHFKTQWAILYPTNAPFIAWPDIDADTPAGIPSWVRIVWQADHSVQASINSVGSRRFRTKGKFYVEARTASGSGKATTLRDAVVTAFEGKTTGPDAVIFREVDLAFSGPDPQGGAWYLNKIAVNFEFDRIK